jgi:hypothetical protein
LSDFPESRLQNHELRKADTRRGKIPDHWGELPKGIDGIREEV